MDASLYFQLRDRIDAATTLEALTTLREEVDAARPHAIERRALERQIERRERSILLPLVEGEVPLLVSDAPADLRRAARAPAVSSEPLIAPIAPVAPVVSALAGEPSDGVAEPPPLAS